MSFTESVIQGLKNGGSKDFIATFEIISDDAFGYKVKMNDGTFRHQIVTNLGEDNIGTKWLEIFMLLMEPPTDDFYQFCTSRNWRTQGSFWSYDADRNKIALRACLPWDELSWKRYVPYMWAITNEAENLLEQLNSDEDE